jgi:hypothetical protein
MMESSSSHTTTAFFDLPRPDTWCILNEPWHVKKHSNHVKKPTAKKRWLTPTFTLYRRDYHGN